MHLAKLIAKIGRFAHHLGQQGLGASRFALQIDVLLRDQGQHQGFLDPFLSDHEVIEAVVDGLQCGLDAHGSPCSK